MEKEEIKDLCVEGLLTDGGHHKQWFLTPIEEARAYAINLGINFENLKDFSDFFDGGYIKGVQAFAKKISPLK